MQDNFSWSIDDSATVTALKISLNAMGGVEDRAHQTIQIMGKYKKKLLQIKVDSSSTHNFLDFTVVKGLGYPLQAIDPVSISVANGQEIWCHYICKQFTWEVQGQYFIADFLVMPLGGCEMVLGIQWLSTLEDIT